MRQLGTEEKAALLLASADDDDNELNQSPCKVQNDNFSIISKRPKTYQRRRRTAPHSVFLLIIILAAFIVGCISGVAIILYRVSQDAEQSSSSSFIRSQDLTIKTKLIQSITKTNFVNLNRSIESENDSANKLEQNWRSLSKVLTRVNKFSYDVTLSTYSPSSQWSGIQLLDDKTDHELAKFNLQPTNDYLTFSSLIKSGRINANYIYYVNYGRQEDFAYLIKKSQIHFENKDKTIIFMRRKSSIISQTEQIRQAIHYRFAALVLFDDDDQPNQITTTNDRQTFSQEWERLSTDKERQKFLDGISNEDDRQIPVLILSYSDVQNIFSSESNKWLSVPNQWHDKPTSLKLGGSLQQTKLRLTTFMQEVPVQLPIVLASIQGTIDAEHFVMIGYQLGRKQQEKIINEIIRAYENQINNGWHPRRSIVFCAWSGLSYDRYTIRRWISDNYRILDRNLIAYIDLGDGVIGNSTLNLHGSPLLQQVAQRAADSVNSPLIHDHTCHHRQTSMSHTHQRRHAMGHGNPMEPLAHEEEETECEPHKLLDEWIRAKNNQIGLNQSSNIVQMIDIESSASLFQLQHGIPSLLIEMTDEQALTNDTFYLKKSPVIHNNDIQPEVIAAYTQFVSEIIRQLIDEPLIPFNLTDYADLIDKQTAGYLTHFDRAYHSLSSHLGDSNELTKLMNDLTKSIRQIQSRIDQTSKKNYIQLEIFNEKLIQFEHLFITNDQSSRHIFLGPAFGLTDTVVPFPLLSNLLFGINNDPQTELADTSKFYWSELKQHFQLITRTINGFDGLLSNF